MATSTTSPAESPSRISAPPSSLIRTRSRYWRAARIPTSSFRISSSTMKAGRSSSAARRWSCSISARTTDNSLIMRLPKEKIIFVVDFLPLSGTQFRVMADTYLPEQEDSMKKILAMDWDRLIPGHPGAGGRQIGNKDDVKTDLDYMLDLSAAVKQAVDAGKSYADAIRDIKLPKYEGLPGYQQNLAGNIERYYDYWNRGI